MIRACVTCGQDTISAREIDNAIRVVDPTPVPDGGLVLVGDLADKPTALWGVDPAGETMPWGTVIPAGAPRYREHECVTSQLAQLGIRAVVTDQVPADVLVVTSADLSDPKVDLTDGRTVVVRLAEEEPHHLAHQTPPDVFDPHCPACRPGATG